MSEEVTATSWRRQGHLLMSPALCARGLIAGATMRGLGSMGGASTAPEDAMRARTALARRLGFAGVIRVKQVHGDTVLRVDAPFAHPWPEADAIWTDRAGLLLGVVAADCVPVLVADDAGRIGAAHAGWEGTSRRVAQRLVRAMRAGGADPAAMVATLGPSIGPCCYSVGPERAATIRDRLGTDAERALVRRTGAGAGATPAPDEADLVFDLWTANADQLRREGVATIEVSGTCTKCGGEDVWSRRSGDVGLLGLAFIGAYEGGKPPSDPPR